MPPRKGPRGGDTSFCFPGNKLKIQVTVVCGDDWRWGSNPTCEALSISLHPSQLFLCRQTPDRTGRAYESLCHGQAQGHKCKTVYPACSCPYGGQRGLSPPRPTAHPVRQGATQPAHTPHVSKTLALDSQNVSPTQVLLSPGEPWGPSKTGKAGSLHWPTFIFPGLASFRLSFRPSTATALCLPQHPTPSRTLLHSLLSSCPPPPCLQLPPLANPRTHTSYPHSPGPWSLASAACQVLGPPTCPLGSEMPAAKLSWKRPHPRKSGASTHPGFQRPLHG